MKRREEDFYNFCKIGFFGKAIGSAFSPHMQPCPALGGGHTWSLICSTPYTAIWSWGNGPVHDIWDNSPSPPLPPEVICQLNDKFPNFWVTSLTHVHLTKRPAQRQVKGSLGELTDYSSTSSKVCVKMCVHAPCLPHVSISSVVKQPKLFMTTRSFHTFHKIHERAPQCVWSCF